MSPGHRRRPLLDTAVTPPAWRKSPFLLLNAQFRGRLESSSCSGLFSEQEKRRKNQSDTNLSRKRKKAARSKEERAREASGRHEKADVCHQELLMFRQTDGRQEQGSWEEFGNKGGGDGIRLEEDKRGRRGG